MPRDRCSAPDQRVRGLDHVAVAVNSAAKHIEWYQNVLGLKVLRDESVASAGVRLIWMMAPGSASDSAKVQLVEPFGPGAVSDFVSQNGDGLHHMCFRVDDLQEFLDERGESQDQIFEGGYSLPCAFLRGVPEGVEVELVEWSSELIVHRPHGADLS